MQPWPALTTLAEDATNDDVAAALSQCAADYYSLRSIHDGLIDWSRTVPTRKETNQ